MEQVRLDLQQDKCTNRTAIHITALARSDDFARLLSRRVDNDDDYS